MEDDPEVPSAVELWTSANWAEREVLDLYGIRFAGHPDLRRILIYAEFEGHPLRKDYPKERRQPLVARGTAWPAVLPDAAAPDEGDFERDLHTEHHAPHGAVPSGLARHGQVPGELDGETIVNIDVQIGYLHRGFEKMCEAGTWYHASRTPTA